MQYEVITYYRNMQNAVYHRNAIDLAYFRGRETRN